MTVRPARVLSCIRRLRTCTTARLVYKGVSFSPNGPAVSCRRSPAQNPPKLWAIIDEAAARRLVGGRQVMSEQLAAAVPTAPPSRRTSAPEADSTSR